MFRLLLNNIFFSVISSVLRFLGSVVFFLVIAHSLGVQEFGKVTLAIAFSQLFLSIVDFGYNLYVIREVSIDRNRIYEFHNTIMASKLLLTAATTIVVALVMFFLQYTSEQMTMIWIAWIGTIFYSYGYYFNSVFRGINQFQFESISVSAYNALQFALVILLLWLGGNAFHIVILYTISRLIYILISYVLFVKTFSEEFKEIDRKKMADMMKTILPFGVHAILGVAYLQLDTIFISYFWNSTQVGLYQSGMRMVVGSMVVYEVLTGAFYPLLSKSSENDLQSFHKYAYALQKYMTLLGLVISLPLLIYTEEIIPLLFGSTFAEAVFIIRLLSVVIFLRFFAAAYGVILTVSHEQSKRAMGVLVSVIINIMFNIYLVKNYGGIGAAVTSVVTHISLFIIYLYFSFKNTSHSYLTVKLFVAGSALIGIGMICYVLKYQFIILSILMLIISVIIVSFLLLDSTERQRIHQLFNRLT